MSYSFLRESKLYIVHGGTKYRIYTTSAIAINQTFAEDSYSVKTLHDQSKMFEGTSITKANPASFSFNVPLTLEKDESIIVTLATELDTSSDSGITTQQLTTNTRNHQHRLKRTHTDHNQPQALGYVCSPT